MGIGSGYVALKVIQWGIRRLDDVEYQSQKDRFKEIFKQYRRPLLIIHNYAMLVATAIAIFHGIILFDGWGADEITGLIAVIIMVVLSIFGLILYYRFRPLWNHSPSRKFLRIIHRQWVLSIILIIFLIIHAE